MGFSEKIVFKEESYKIIGACMKVHRTLGPGFLEAVYEEALEKEFQGQKIPFKKQVNWNCITINNIISKFHGLKQITRRWANYYSRKKLIK